METTHEFGLALGEVEGVTVGLREGADDEQDEGKRLVEHVPARQEAEDARAGGVLLHDDLAQVERVADGDHGKDAEDQRQLVADHLRRCAQTAVERVLGVAGPAAEDHAVDAEAADGHDPERTGVEVRDGQQDRRSVDLGDLAGEGNHRHGHQCCGRGDGRSQNEEPAVGSFGHELLLEDELEPVGHGLQHAERTHTVGAHAVLDPRTDLALRKGANRGAGDDPCKDRHDLDQRGKQDGHWAAPCFCTSSRIRPSG